MRNKYKIIPIILLSIYTFGGCTNDEKVDFYCDTIRDYGVWRIPISYPYELITVDSSSFWSFYCPQTAKHFFQDYSVDSVAFYNKQILFFSHYGNTNNFMLLNSVNGNVTDFKSRISFMKFRSTDSVWKNLYAVKDLFKDYLKIRSLPWSNQIPNYKLCK
jgi:hypothetical protein